MSGWGLSWLETATQKIKEVNRSLDAAVGLEDDDDSSPTPGMMKAPASAPTTPAAHKAGAGPRAGDGHGRQPASATPQPPKSAGWGDVWNSLQTGGTGPADSTPVPTSASPQRLGAAARPVGAAVVKPAAGGPKTQNIKAKNEEPSLEDLLNSDVLLTTASPKKKPPSAPAPKSASSSPVRSSSGSHATAARSRSASSGPKRALSTTALVDPSADSATPPVTQASEVSTPAPPSTEKDVAIIEAPSGQALEANDEQKSDKTSPDDTQQSVDVTPQQEENGVQLPPSDETSDISASMSEKESEDAHVSENNQPDEPPSHDENPTQEEPNLPSTAPEEQSDTTTQEPVQADTPDNNVEEPSVEEIAPPAGNAADTDDPQPTISTQEDEQDSEVRDDLDEELEQEWTRQAEEENKREETANTVQHLSDEEDELPTDRIEEIRGHAELDAEPMGSQVVETREEENEYEEDDGQRPPCQSETETEPTATEQTSPKTSNESEIVVQGNPERERELEERVRQLENQVISISRVLGDRERQVETLAREHAKAQDSWGQITKEKEDALRLLRETESRMASMRDDFVKNANSLERNLSAITKERDSLRQELRKREDKDLEDSEKDEILNELRIEGEKLSKKQLQLESTIKQLRAKEKDSEATIAALKEQLASAEAQIEDAQSKTRDNDVLLSKYNDMVAGLKESAEVAGRKSEEKDRLVAAAQQRVSELEMEREKALRQASEARKMLQAAEERREADLEKARNEAKEAMHEAIRKSEEREAALSLTIQQLRSSLTNLSEQTAGREELLRQEIQSLQGRLAAAEARAAEVSTTIAEATAPLVRQIDSLHHAHSHAIQEQHRIEQVLNERIKEEEDRAEAAHAELQKMHDSMTKLRTRLRDLEKENEELSAQMRDLQQALQEAKHKAEQADAEKEAAQKAAQAANKSALQAQREFESKLAHEVNKVREQEQARFAAKEQDLLRQAKEKLPESSLSVRPNINPYAQHSNWAKPLSSDKIDTSRYRDADIANLQNLLAAAEKSKRHLEDELVALTASNDTLSRRVSELEAMEGRLADMQRRYATALELVGEKTEQVEELRADLADMKQLYRTQISDLLNKIDMLSKHH